MGNACSPAAAERVRSATPAPAVSEVDSRAATAAAQPRCPPRTWGEPAAGFRARRADVPLTARHLPRIVNGQRGAQHKIGKVMAKRKYDPVKLSQAAADWDVHHALVAGVRRLVRLAGGPQEAKDVIDAVAAADALEEDTDDTKPPAP